MRLSTKFTLTTLIPTLAFLLLLAWTVRHDLVNYLRNSSHQIELDKLYRVKSRLVSDVQGMENVIQLIPSAGALSGAEAMDIRIRLEVFQREIRDIIQLSVLTLQGTVALRVDEFQLSDDKDIVNEYLFNSPVFREPLLKKRIYTGGLARSTAIGVPTINLSLQIKNRDTGNPSGVLWAVVALRNFAEALHANVSSEGAIGVFDNQANQIVYQLGRPLNINTVQLVAEDVASQPFTVNGIVYTLSKIPIHYQDLNLTLYSLVPNSTIYQLSDSLERRNIIIILLATVFVLVTVTMLIKHLTKKLASTTRSITQMASFYHAGAWVDKTGESKDEVVQLSAAFNTLKHAIQTRQQAIEILNQDLESKVIQRTHELEAANKDLQLAASVFEHANEGIMITNGDGVILDVNQAFTKMTGYQPEEVIGRTPSFLASGRHDARYFSRMWTLLTLDGRWSGEIWNSKKDGEAHVSLLSINAIKDEQDKPQQYVALYLDITIQKEHEKQLKHMAQHDVLTGLPNRILLADRMEQAMLQKHRRHQTLVIAYLDLDGFKAVNDQYGHAAGDQLLVNLAERLKTILCEGDTIARLGGDEFVAIINDVSTNVGCVPILERILQAAAAPFYLDNDTVQVTASLGVTFYPQADQIDADQLLRQADQAMYQAKLMGKNRYQLFDVDLDKNVRSQHENRERIRQALENDELVLHYQPKVNMRTGNIFGVEALIRWQKPGHELLMPACFIPLIEHTPLSVEMSNWVIQKALAQIDRWQSMGLNLPVSVNISGTHLQQSSFVNQLKLALKAYDEPIGQLLELEILESCALKDMAHVSNLILDCQKLGISVALDDFGAGYSSLAYLKRLPANTLKIDQEFVRDMLVDPDDLAILEGVLKLAETFQRKAIAEGVETLEHGRLLLQLGCEQAQGNYIAKPMPAEKIPIWIQHWEVPQEWKRIRSFVQDERLLIYASTDYRAWIQRIERYIDGSSNTPPPMEATAYRFGIWLNGKGRQQYGSLDSFQKIIPLHQEVHQLAYHLVKFTQAGKRPQAREELIRLYYLRDRLLDLLSQLWFEHQLQQQQHLKSA